ncbi:MAG: radical SAM protein [Myxococcota bacterium]|nr:radical SAM protein [Myxococcota bacterium]
MSRVVFVDNLLFEDAEGIRRYVLQPHLGLISLIAVLEEAGHTGILFDPKVEIDRGALRLDGSLYREMGESILRLNPDVVGMTSLGCNFICTVKVARHLKSVQPDLPILLGGPHATVLDEAILDAFVEFDAIARNEAERTILPLVEATPGRRFDRVPGVSYRRRGRVERNAGVSLIENLDELPVPAYRHHPVAELGLDSLRVEAGRGCPFQCTFCSTATFFGRRYRLKTAERLVAELDFLRDTYGVTDFALTHDLFTVDRRKVREFCEAVRERGYTWKCSARMDCVDAELLEEMAASGCRSIYYGIEAGSERMQRLSKKRLDLGLFQPTLAATQRVGMSATVSFITGYPEETLEDQSETLDMVGGCFGHDDSPLNVQLHLLTPEPGTELLEARREEIEFDGHISDFNFPPLSADDPDLLREHPGVFINHHYFPATLPRYRHLFVTTAFHALHSLGPPFLRFLIRRYGGRFHRLVDAMERWARRNGEGPKCDHALVERYFAASHGEEHYVTGLIRYMLRAAQLRRRASFEAEVECAEIAEGAYRLSARAAILRNVPDCPAMLEHLARCDEDPIPRRYYRKRLDLLLLLPRGRESTVQNFEITEASAALLEFLDSTSDPRRNLGEFEVATGYPLPQPEFLRSLADRGVLEGAAGFATR